MSVSDLDRYGEAYLSYRKSDPNVLAMETNAYVVNPGFSYGLGWVLSSLKGHPMIYHSGGNNGYTAAIYLIPDLHISVAVASNRGSDDPDEYARALVEAALTRSSHMDKAPFDRTIRLPSN
jgi:CubicO group peptidase (beta-lactamase class C family)